MGVLAVCEAGSCRVCGPVLTARGLCWHGLCLGLSHLSPASVSFHTVASGTFQTPWGTWQGC